MAYWNVPKDVNGDGDKDDPNDNMPNYVWTHLYIYKDLAGTLPDGRTPKDRVHVGKEIPVQVDHGPSGQPLQGEAQWSGDKGGNVVFTESRFGKMADMPLVLTASHLWDALGLPLTAFDDGVLKGGSHRTIDEKDFQPFQEARVTLLQAASKEPVQANGKPVSFIGTNPVDLPNCIWCHSSDRANSEEDDNTGKYKQEYAYWKSTYPDQSEFMARLSAAAISILDIHDTKFHTHFLDEYAPEASTNRLGSRGPVNWSDCHGDNVQGRLKVRETPEDRAIPMTEAIHQAHLKAVPDGDSMGRTQSCQMCHPTHLQDPSQNVTGQGFSAIGKDGKPRFTDGDIR